MQAFHVTKRTSISHILKSGLKPRIGPRSQVYGETQPAIYCFSSLEDCADGLGGWMADAFENVPDGGLVILELKIPEGFRLEKKAGYELSLLDQLPVENITAVFEENLQPSLRLNARLKVAAENI